MASSDGLQKRQVRTLPRQNVCAVCADNHETLPDDLRLENGSSCWIPEYLLCQIRHFLNKKPDFNTIHVGEEAWLDPRQGEGSDDPGRIE